MELERTSYEAALRSLDRQEQRLGEIRSRTGILIAASSLAASFFGRPTAEDGFSPLLIAALVTFTISLAASLYVLLPRRDLFFTIRGGGLYEEHYEWREDAAEVYRRLAYALDRVWDVNDARLTRVFVAFTIAAGALAAEVIFLMAAAVGATVV